MQNTAEKIEDLNPSGLSYFKRQMYQDAIEFWNSALMEDILDYLQVQEINEAKKCLSNIPEGKGKKEKIFSQLNALLELYQIDYVDSFRSTDNNNLTPAADILLHQNGNFLVIDEFNHRIQIYDEKGSELKSFGKRGNEKGEFYYPKALAEDSKGNLYVADCWNHRVQKFSPELQFVTAFGSYGSKEGEFNEPYDIAVDKEDRLFVVDRCNHRVQVFDSEGSFLNTFGHRGSILEEELAEYYGTPKELFSLPAFEFPTKIAFDSKENLYIADSGNCRIQRLSKQGEVVSSIGEKGEGSGQFEYPFDITIDSKDNIFVSDPISNKIQQFTPQGLHILTLKGCGDNDNDNDEKSLLQSPSVITIDEKARLIVSEDLSTGIKIFQVKEQDVERIYQEKTLLDLENASIHTSLADFYSENERWNEAKEKYAQALSKGKNTIDTKIKLAKSLIKSNNAEDDDLKYLDKIIDFTDDSKEVLEREIAEVCEKDSKKEKVFLSKKWKEEERLLEGSKDDDEINQGVLQLEHENRQTRSEVRAKLSTYKKTIVNTKKLISLLFTLIETEHFRNRKNELIKNTIQYIRKDWESTLTYLESEKSLAIVPFLEIKNEIVTSLYRYFSDLKPNKPVQNKKEFSRYLSESYFRLNENLLNYLKRRKAIYSEIEEKINSCSLSEAEFAAGSNIKGLYNELIKLNRLLMFFRTKTAELIQNSIGEILNELKTSDKKHLEEYIYSIEEINWMMWENAYFAEANEICITSHFNLVSILAQEKFIDGIKEEKNCKKDYFDKAITILNKIESYTSEDDSSFNELRNFIDNEIEVLKNISENHQSRFNKSIEEIIKIEDKRIKRSKLSDKEIINLQNLSDAASLGKQIHGYDFYQSKKIIITVLEKTIKIIENHLDSGKSLEELIKITEWVEKLWRMNHEAQNSKKNAISEKLKQENVCSEAVDICRGDLGTEKAIHECFQHKINSFFTRVRKQLNQEISNRFLKNSADLVKKGEFHKALDLKEEVLKSCPSKSCFSLKSDDLSDEINDRITYINQRYFIKHDTSFGKTGKKMGEFLYPTCTTKDSEENLLICDLCNHRIQKFTIDGELISSFGTFGTLPGELYYPFGLAIDKDGFVYVSNLYAHTVNKYSSKGEFILSFGRFGSGEGEFNQPANIAIDSSQNIYISDRLNRRVQKFSSNGEFLMSFDNSENDEISSSEPGGIFVDKNDEIFLGEYLGGKIQKIKPDGKCLSTLGKTGIKEKEFNGILDFAKDTMGNIYVSDFMNHRIQKLDNEFDLIWSFGTYGTADGDFRGPLGLEVVDKYLFVCDYHNNRVQRFTISK